MKQILSLLSLLLLLIGEKGECQYNENKIFQLHIAPLNVFTPYTGVVQAGFQKRFNQRFALAVDYGFKFRNLSIYSKNDGRLNYTYYTVKGEVKYFIALNKKNKSDFANPYFSLQGFYLHQQYDRENGWLYTNNKSYHYDRSTISRNAVVASLLIGDERVKKRMLLDYYIGLGIRKIRVDHHKTTGAVEAQRSFPVEYFGRRIGIDEQEGTFYRPHLAWGFKLGYIFNKK